MQTYSVPNSFAGPAKCVWSVDRVTVKHVAMAHFIVFGDYIQEKCRTMQLPSVCVIPLCVFTCTNKGTPAMMLECNI